MYQYLEEEPSEKSKKCCTDRLFAAICLWILQTLIWAAIAYIVLYYTRYGYLYDLPFGVTIVSVIVYIYYVIIMFVSPTYEYLKNKKNGVIMYDKMTELFKKPPEIILDVDCYHYEKRVTSEEPVKVTTYSETVKFHYYSVKDVSGLFLLDGNKELQAKKAFIKLYLKTEVNFADTISFMDYALQKEALYNENKYRDAYININEKRTIEGLHDYNLIQISDYQPAGVNKWLYILLTWIPLCQFYKLYIDSLCVSQKFKIRKLVSTRYNLLESDYLQQYQTISPALYLHDKMYSYKGEETGFCFANPHVRVPTEKELQLSLKYSKEIPNYEITSVSRDVDGIQIGVVQDIPKFYNHVYKVPAS